MILDFEEKFFYRKIILPDKISRPLSLSPPSLHFQSFSTVEDISKTNQISVSFHVHSQNPITKSLTLL